MEKNRKISYPFSRFKIKSDLQQTYSDEMDIKELSKISIKVCDNCCFLIICPTHKRIMLMQKGYVFLPWIPLNPMKTWHESSMEGALHFLFFAEQELNPEKLLEIKDRPFRKFVCLQILRFQLPQTERFITRLMYLAELDSENPNVVCCTNTTHFQWYTMNQAISSTIYKIWGPEVSYFTYIASLNKKMNTTGDEYSLTDAFKYIPRDLPNTPEEQILSNANITFNDVERLYADFIEHCFPSFFLTRYSFEMYLKKHQIECDPKIIARYYTAFRFRGKLYMQFHELLLGLAAIDNRAPHEELRYKFLFRYYDDNRDEYLNLKEFRRLIKDLELISQPTNQYIKNIMKKLGTITVKNEEVINYEIFKQSIMKGLLRGTAKLCRAKVSPFGQITRSLATKKSCTTISNKKLKNILLNQPYNGHCYNCKKKVYGISTTIIVLDHKGFVKNFKPIPSNELIDVVKISPGRGFDKSSVLYFIFNGIHEFNKVKNYPQKFQKGLFSNLSRNEIQAFSEDFKFICMEVCKIVENESRILKLEDPIYVMGDIHGNLEDLISLEQCLWKNFPLLTANYLFLGDYVDRGRWGFECFLYLLISKYISPKKIFLLRGNHEIRTIQYKYSFHKELIRKYGNIYGKLFFDLTNEVFDRLPFSAVINDTIFCAHGGLPYSEQNLEKLNQEIPKIIRDPENQARAVWEILWSDPLEYSKFGEIAETLGLPINLLNGLFLPNSKRGTSYYFNEYAVIAFFKENNLSYMIRAHEVPVSGFKFNFGTLCTTIFSCSHYYSAHNECAVVLLDRESRIRLIRIDTSQNFPAMTM